MTALDAWRSLLGADRVVVEPTQIARLAMNITEYPARRVPAILHVANRREVEAVIAIARAHRAAVYPISTGKNWGVGSKLPVNHDAAVVDMSGMNRILEVNERFEYAVVEPGVTQRALFEHLAKREIPLRFNMTGSGEETSIVGNLLERGVGMLGQRTQDIRGLEVVTGSGRVVRTGLWHCFDGGTVAAPACAHHYPAGFGPDLTGLFLQSNLGITTAAVVGLRPRESVTLALLRTEASRLSPFVDAIARLRKENVLRDRVEIDGDDDPRLHGLGVGGDSALHSWWTWAALWGDREIV